MTVLSNENLLQKMRDFIQSDCLLKSDFTLSSGSSSNHYFDIKKASLNGSFLSWFSEYVIDVVIPANNIKADVVGGITLGADFLTACLLQKAYQKGLPMINGSIVRKEPKKHGTKSLIENEIEQGGRKILVIEDVVTSGKSIDKACEVFLKAGYEVVGLLTVVDRETGGIEFLQEKYQQPVIHLFQSSEFTI